MPASQVYLVAGIHYIVVRTRQVSVNACGREVVVDVLLLESSGWIGTLWRLSGPASPR